MQDGMKPICEICAECRFYEFQKAVVEDGWVMPKIHPCAKDGKYHAVNERACYLAEPLNNENNEQENQF